MDPRVVAVGDRKDQRSELLKAQARTPHGEKVNACPFGCELPDLDDNGYCKHLIGFTNDGKVYEPMVKQRGRRVVKVDRDKIATGEINEDGKPDFEYGPPQLPAIPKGAKLVQISTSARVYMDLDKQPPAAKSA